MKILQEKLFSPKKIRRNLYITIYVVDVKIFLNSRKNKRKILLYPYGSHTNTATVRRGVPLWPAAWDDAMSWHPFPIHLPRTT